MRVTRRTLLGSAALAAGAVAMPCVALAATGALHRALAGIITDPTTPAGRLAAAHARSSALPLAERGHDLATLFHGGGPGSGPTPAWLHDGRQLAGVTGWAGLVLAQGIAKERGLPFAAGLPAELDDLAAQLAGMPAFCWTVG